MASCISFGVADGLNARRAILTCSPESTEKVALLIWSEMGEFSMREFSTREFSISELETWRFSISEVLGLVIAILDNTTSVFVGVSAHPFTLEFDCVW